MTHGSPSECCLYICLSLISLGLTRLFVRKDSKSLTGTYIDIFKPGQNSSLQYVKHYKRVFLIILFRTKFIMYRENKTKTNKFHIHQRLLRHLHQRKLRHLLLTMVMKSTKSNTDCVPAIPPGKTSKAKHK